jgi:hypothetical protein
MFRRSDRPIERGDHATMRTTSRLILTISLSAAFAGCDSAMVDATAKPEITGRGPREPEAPGKNPGSGKVDLGEVGRSGSVETQTREGPQGAPRPVSSPDGKAH